MKVHILSHNMATIYPLPKKDKNILIRVLEPTGESKPLKYKDQYQDILKVRFDDLTEKQLLNIESQKEREEYTLISDKDANHILDFYKKHQDADNIVIHCAAGISRSAGIALALAKYRNDSSWEEQVWKDHIPNMYVVNKIVSLFSSEIVEDRHPIEDMLVEEEFSWDF